MRSRVLRHAALTLPLPAMLPCPALAASEIIDGWTDLLLSSSRLVIVFAAFLGLLYVGSSLLSAYRADMDEARVRHVLAAVFAGVFTIIGVIIGWISGLLVPG